MLSFLAGVGTTSLLYLLLDIAGTARRRNRPPDRAAIIMSIDIDFEETAERDNVPPSSPEQEGPDPAMPSTTYQTPNGHYVDPQPQTNSFDSFLNRGTKILPFLMLLLGAGYLTLPASKQSVEAVDTKLNTFISQQKETADTKKAADDQLAQSIQTGFNRLNERFESVETSMQNFAIWQARMETALGMPGGTSIQAAPPFPRTPVRKKPAAKKSSVLGGIFSR